MPKTYEWRDPARMTIAVLIILAVDGAVEATQLTLLAAWGRAIFYGKVQFIQTGPQWAELTIGLVSMLATSAGLLNIFWLLRASRNAHALKGRALRNTPMFSAIWWWIIPLMSLFKPVSAIGEIWDVSAVNSERWRHRRWVLSLWWASHLGNGLSTAAIFAFQRNVVVQMIAEANLVIRTAAFAYIVGRISAMQVEKHTVGVFADGPERPLSVLERLNG